MQDCPLDLKFSYFSLSLVGNIGYNWKYPLSQNTWKSDAPGRLGGWVIKFENNTQYTGYN